MEKLVKKFEKINGRMLSQHGNAISSAEEARKLALEFAKSLNGMCIGSWNLEHTYNELFDKFIDEYYE